MDLVTDRAMALFAGTNVVPKRSSSASITRSACASWRLGWIRSSRSGLHGASFDLDFHSVPADSAEEPLEKHYVSSRSRSQKGILVFLARETGFCAMPTPA